MAHDEELKLAEMEAGNLRSSISAVEAALAASTPGTRAIFAAFLDNARAHLFTVERKVKEATENQHKDQENAIAMSAIAERERNLSQQEKEDFGTLLQKPYFTKADFGHLQTFYTRSYDRLSENGKAELSQRVWTGVRKEDYQFTDLPAIVQEKEAARAYTAVKQNDSRFSNLDAIPQEEKAALIGAFENGRKEEAPKILNHECFSKNMSVRSPTKGDAAIDLSGIDLSGLQAGASTPSIPAKEVANGNASSERNR